MDPPTSNRQKKRDSKRNNKSVSIYSSKHIRLSAALADKKANESSKCPKKI